MDALKDACRASGDYSITLIPYYAQVIADFDTADTVRQRRFESLQKLHGQLHLYKKEGMRLSYSVHWPREKRNSL